MQKLRNPTKTFFVNIQLAPMHNRHHHHKHIICYNIITKRIVTPLLGDVLYFLKILFFINPHQLMWHCWLALMLWALCMSVFAPLFRFRS